MKNNVFNILKYTTINNLKLNKYKDKSGRKSIFKIGLTYLFIGLFIIGYVIIYSSSMYNVAKPLNMQTYILPLFIAVVSMFVAFSVMRMSGDVLFKSKDYDSLMTMPITHKEIFVSKLIYIVFMNYLTVFIITIPCAIYMMAVEKLSIAYLLIAVLFTLFVPVIPMIIGTIVSVIIGYLSSKSKFTTMITNFLLIFATLLIMLLPNGLSSIANNMSIEQIDISVKKIFYPLYMIKNGLANYSIIDIIGYVGINIILIYIYVLLTNKFFIKINQKLKEKYKGKKYVEKKLKSETPISSMYKKEIKKLFGTSLYFMNTCIGYILLLFFAIGSIFVDNTTIFSLLAIPEMENIIEPIVIAAIISVTSMSSTTGCSISLEGNKLWIYKTMPVKTMDVFFSKILVNLTISIPTILISGIILILRFGLGRQYAILVFVLPILLSIATSLFGLLVNLKFPVFSFESEIYVIKKSFASFLTIMVPMILSIISIIIILSLQRNYITNYLIFTFIAIFLDVVMLYILEKWGIKRFNKLEM